jgi:exodeoxyribonuclease-5
MQLSSDKKQALNQLVKWFRSNYKRGNYITLGGYAGTGKTTLIAILRRIIFLKNKKINIAFASYTGKASQVLRNYLKQSNTFYKQDFVGTIHSLIYSPIVSTGGRITGWKKKDKIDYDLIIIDEASMVSSDIWQDLRSYQIPIIAVGDHGQLPPINDSFHLMDNPHLKLETIHRQAKKNPIIKVSIIARKKGIIPPKNYGRQVIKINQSNVQAQELAEELLNNYDPETMVLTGYNFSRKQLNQSIRNSLGFFEDKPEANDRVICLRNNHSKGIYNGMLGTILSINQEDTDWYYAEIKMDNVENPYQGLISIEQFQASKTLSYTQLRKKGLKGDLFDFGYALTVHKAQGSQAKKVILFEQRFKQMDDEMWKRWLYTAVTRAEEELYIFGEG